jgi:hypothetical protein
MAFVGSFGMIASSTSVLAQARVLASSGGAVESYPKGTRLANDTILLLGRGDSVTIAVDNVKRTFPGPGKFPINRAVQERSSVSILDSILNFITGDSAVASGAARGRSSSSSIASATRNGATARGRTGAVRPTAMPPPPPPPAPSPPPPPVAYDMAPPEFAMDVPMPDVMPQATPDAMPDVMAARVPPGGGGGGGSSTSTYAFSDPAPDMPGRQFFDIDIGKSENICLTPLGKLQLWRAVADDPLSINIVRQSDGRAIELTFDAYEQSKSWPEPFDAAPAGDYAIVNVADDTASLISIIPAGTTAENLGELAVAYSSNECTGQLAALETRLNTDGLEPTVATVFGTGTR